jgi:hypothetical protein
MKSRIVLFLCLVLQLGAATAGKLHAKDIDLGRSGQGS